MVVVERGQLVKPAAARLVHAFFDGVKQGLFFVGQGDGHGVILARWLWSWSEQLQHCQHSKECKQHVPLLSQHFDLVGLTVSQFHCS